MSRSIVDTERISAAAGDIHRIADTVQSSMGDLRGRLSSLNGAWEGPAKIEFERVMQDFQATQGKVTQLLGDIGQLTLKASTAYAEHETNTRALFAR